MSRLRERLLFGALIPLMALAVGASLVWIPELAVTLMLFGAGWLALAAPATLWAMGALVAALVFRSLVTLGVLPDVATFFDIPLAWGALAAALVRRRTPSPGGDKVLRGVAALGIVALASGVLHPTEPVRILLYVALIAEPFVLVAALLLDPPTLGLRRALVSAMVTLIAVQVPVAYWQLFASGPGDGVQGTLFGAGAGAHTISAVVTVGAIWLLFRYSLFRVWHLIPVGLLLTIPFLADAKQVIFVLPAALLATRLRRGTGPRLGRALTIVAIFVGLVSVLPARDAAFRFIERAAAGQGGKAAVASLVWRELLADPAALLVGKGPAQTVSRSAFMTTDLFLRSESPLRIFRLKPALFAQQAEARARQVSAGGTSFNSGTSSALGVLGDLGLVGAAIYLALLIYLFFMLRRGPTAAAQAAAAGWAMFGILGLIFDWWEQPPFSVFLAVLSAIGLASRGTDNSDGTLPSGRMDPMGQPSPIARTGVLPVWK